jgi:hypothetical protein
MMFIMSYHPEERREPMPPIDRDRQFHLLLSDEELERLKEVSGAFDMSASDYLRFLLGWHYEKQEHKESRDPQMTRAVGMLKKAKLAHWDSERAHRAVEPAKPKARR